MLMVRIMVFSLLLTGLYSGAFALDESYWSNRNSQDGAKAGYDYYKGEYGKEKNYENAWEFARAAYFYADNFIKKPELKKVIFTEAKLASEDSTNYNPAGVEGHYYLAVSLGSWAEANGVFASLGAVGPILKEAGLVIKL